MVPVLMAGSERFWYYTVYIYAKGDRTYRRSRRARGPFWPKQTTWSLQEGKMRKDGSQLDPMACLSALSRPHPVPCA